MENEGALERPSSRDETFDNILLRQPKGTFFSQKYFCFFVLKMAPHHVREKCRCYTSDLSFKS